MSSFFDVALQVLTSRHAPEVIDHIGAGETGCVDCGFIGKHAEFRPGKRGARFCPSCGVDIRDKGYFDGDEILSLAKTKKATLVGSAPERPSKGH